MILRCDFPYWGIAKISFTTKPAVIAKNGGNHRPKQENIASAVEKCFAARSKYDA
jgi:hypothetical protein